MGKESTGGGKQICVGLGMLGLLLFLTAVTVAAGKGALREVTDMDGRKVKIPARVERVIGTGGAVDEWLLLLGCPEKLVVTSDTIRKNPWYVKIYPAIKNVPAAIVGSDIDAESLLTLRPDVAILLSGMALQQTVEKTGVPFVVLERRNPEELMQGIRNAGRVLGEQAARRAEEFCRDYQANIRRVTTKTRRLPAGRRPLVYYAGAQPLSTEGKDTMVTAWIEMAGGVNVAATHGLVGMSQNVSLENLLDWNPEFIVAFSPETKAAIMNNPAWGKIAAVRKNQVIVNPKGIYSWGVRSADEALQVLWAAKTLHPELFKELDVVAEVKRFHAKYYHDALTDEDVQQMLQALPPK